MRKGHLFTFEGLTNSNKDKTLEQVASQLRTAGYDVVVTSEPYSEELTPTLRKALQDKTWSEKSRLFLFMADHFYHLDEVVKPALAEGKIVLCDRYSDSRCAYQAAGLSEDHDELTSNIHWINSVHNKFHFLTPNKTFIFDIPSEEAATKARKSDSEYLITDDDFLSRVRTAYHIIAELNPNRMEVIDSDESIENMTNNVSNQILRIVSEQ